MARKYLLSYPTTNQEAWYQRLKLMPIIWSILFLITAGAVYALSEADYVWPRIGVVTGMFFIVLLAMVDNVYDVRQKEQRWGLLADRTGLTCEVSGSWLLGYSVQVVGNYRGRQLSIFTYKQGKGQVPSTCIELKVTNPAHASLRMRGPFTEKSATTDVVVKDMFEATKARQFGFNQRFFVRSNPLHLVTAMFNTQTVRHRLADFDTLINIELEEKTLQFNNVGVLGDVEQLQGLIELLSDIADIIERGSFTKLRALPQHV